LFGVIRENVSQKVLIEVFHAYHKKSIH
jgi:hypothetical protein